MSQKQVSQKQVLLKANHIDSGSIVLVNESV